MRLTWESTDMPTLISALYGDEAVQELGYTPLGLSTNAGLALGLEGMVKAPPPARSHSNNLYKISAGSVPEVP